MDTASFWWNTVPVGSRYLNDIISYINSYNHISLPIGDLPWAEQVRTEIEARKNQGYLRRMGFFSISGASARSSDSVLSCLIDSVGLRSSFDGTFASVRDSLGDDGCVFWMIGLEADQLDELNNLITESVRERMPVSFVVECGADIMSNAPVFHFSYDEVHLRYLAWTCLLEAQDTNLIEYKAELAITLSQGDPERCALCCERIRDCLNRPEKICTWFTAEQIEQAVYEAQIRFLMPLLERDRLRFIDLVGDRLDPSVLPFEETWGKTTTTYSRVKELEFRHLLYQYNEQNLKLNSDEYYYLKIHYDARNSLAHLHSIRLDKINELIKLTGRLFG